jgi:hypothetical protein
MTYRVHIFANGGSGRWVASKDYTARPDQEAITGSFKELQGPGWFEVRVSRLKDGEEYALSAWTQEDGTPGRKSLPATPVLGNPRQADCTCGTPSRARFYLSGVIGRGDERRGTETEELSQYCCAKHATRALVNAALRERTKADPDGTAQFGPWKVLEFSKRKLAGSARL